MATDLPPLGQIPERRSPFAPGLPNFQIAWDSTSLGLLKECPRKYYYEIILGWEPRGKSVHLIFGQLYHAALERYDHATFAGADHQEGVRAALRHVLGYGAWIDSGDGPKWEGWRSSDPYKNIWTLCRTIVWYLDHFKDTPLKTLTLSNGKPAVELSFYFPAFEVNGFQIGLAGHLDRVVEEPSIGFKPAVHDRKTTKGQLNDRYFQGFSPHNQFTLYTVAANVHYERPTHGITVDAAQVLVNSSAFLRRHIGRPPAVVNEWLAETQVWVGQALSYAEAAYWPMNDKSCGNYGGCPFQKVCAKSPTHRKSWLEADFEHRVWNPLEQRGDI